MAGSGPAGAGRVAGTALLGAIALASLIFSIVSIFVPNTKTGESLLYMLPFFLAPLPASLGGIAMLWLRRGAAWSRLRLAVEALLWFLGVWLIGASFTAALLPSDLGPLANIGLSMAICLAPGAVLSMAGLGLYWHDWRRATLPSAQQGIAGAGELQAASAATDDVLMRAAAYRRGILSEIRGKKGRAFAGTLAEIPEQLGRWAERLAQLRARLATYEADPVLVHDRRAVPAAIARLEEQLPHEGDASVREQMQETLGSYQEHQKQLEQLANLMRRTQLQMEETLTTMGTVYSQLQALDALDVDGPRASHIAQDIDRQVASLGDLLSAMSETYTAPDRGVPAAGSAAR